MSSVSIIWVNIPLELAAFLAATRQCVSVQVGNLRFDQTTAELLETLPVERRLALAYAPARSHKAWLGLLALDARLGDVVRRTGDPLLAQLKLSWWRDQLGKATTNRSTGEPVLAALTAWSDDATALQILVDGWEQLIGQDKLDGESFGQFVAARGAACGALAVLLGDRSNQVQADRAGRCWALADLVGKLTQAEEAGIVLAAIAREDWAKPRLSREMRPLLVLHAIARNSKDQGMSNLSSSTLFSAMRLGLLGF